MVYFTTGNEDARLHTNHHCPTSMDWGGRQQQVRLDIAAASTVL